jgi:uncharacterized protein (DUF2147 family)
MKSLALLTIMLLAATTVFGAGQNDILGLWKTADDESKLEFFKCGEKICVKIAWMKEPNYTDSKEGPVGTPKVDSNNPDVALKNRPMIGLQIMEGFTAVDDSHWEDGIIYNPDNGKTYRGKLHLISAGKLELRGYMGISLFGRNYLLTR